MRNFYVAVTFLCAVLLALLLLLVLAADKLREPEAIAPEVNAEGLCIVTVAKTAITTPAYELYFTEADVTAMAQMLYGEARGCELLNQQQAVWCVLNRVDDSHFPNTIIGVLSQPHQFHGYSSSFPVWADLKEVARDVMTRWSMEKQGATVERELSKNYLWFTGDGEKNIFRESF